MRSTLALCAVLVALAAARAARAQELAPSGSHGGAPAQEAAAPERHLPADELQRWAASDAEGRWFVYARSVALDPARAHPWVQHARAERDLATLELVALYGEPQMQQQALEALVELDAPQWLRAALWIVESAADSHTITRAREALDERPALVRAYLARHPDAQTRYVPPARAAGAPDDPRALDVRDYPRPWTAREVFAALDPSAERESLGDRVRAEPGVLYRFQVLRAIDAYARFWAHTFPWNERLAAFALDPDPLVAQRACLAYAHFEPERVPCDALLRIVDDPTRPDAVREAALLGFSYGPEPRVWVELHRVARDPEHAAWKAAVSRLGDLGNAFTLEHLAHLTYARLSVDAEVMSELERSLLRAELDRVRQREKALDADPESFARRVVPLFERSAWAQLAASPAEDELRAWTLATAAAWAAREPVRATLEALAASYEGDVPAGEVRLFGPIAERVRRYAADALAASAVERRAQ